MEQVFMTGLMDDPVISIPPLSEESVRGSVVPVDELSERQRDGMFVVFERYFEADRSVFERDLSGKESAIVLTAQADGAETIVGFSTLLRVHLAMKGKPVTILFSGDTVVDRSHWGHPLLPRLWSRHVFQLAASIAGQEVYWFLISSGFRTYRYLPLFFREFSPKRGELPALDSQGLLDCVAQQMFGDRYDRATGIVRLEHRTPLRRGVSEMGRRELSDPDVLFFLERNPGHADGDELACLVRIDPANLTRAGERMVYARS
jgi:hypothetical protein